MVHHVCAPRWEEALEHAQWAMEAYEGIGNIRSWGYALYMKAVCWAYMARLAEADDACAHLIGVARDAADAQLASWGRGTRGFVLRRQGRWEEAAGELRLAAEVARSIDDHVVHMWSLAELGRSLLFQGHTDAALAALEQSRQVRRDYRHIRLIWVQVDAAVAEGYLTATENAGTREAGHFRREARLACRSSLRNARSFRCLMPEAARHMGSLCWLEGRPARARRWWSRSLSEAVETGQRLDEAWTLLEMATRLGTEEYRSRYEALFRETGVTQTASHRVDIAHDRGPWAGG
jgi:tetratricopeptide (TPR) repeat protein